MKFRGVNFVTAQALKKIPWKRKMRKKKKKSGGGGVSKLTFGGQRGGVEEDGNRSGDRGGWAHEHIRWLLGPE